MQDISLFFGRFHPLIVHIPIGIILFAFSLEVYSFFTGNKFRQVIVLAYLLTALSGGLAAFIGYLLSTSGGYDDSTLNWHKWLGITTSILALLLAKIKSSDALDRKIGKLTLSQACMILTIAVVSVTGHLGGNLTHGSTYLTEYMPGPIKKIFLGEQIQEHREIPMSVDSVNMYEHIIQPMLNAKCQSCHNPSKMQGDLDLTNIEGIERGGLSGHAIEGGKLNKSEIFKRVTLPRESKKFMPPNNKPGFTNVELNLMNIWIENGASFEKKLHELHPDEKETYMASVYLGISNSGKEGDQLPIVTEINEELMQELISEGLMIDYIADQSALVDVSFVNVAKGQASELLKKITGLSVNIYKLNLSNCELHDEDLESIKTMTNLNFLRLENNQLTGATLSLLIPLKQLNYLNLNGNPLDNSAKDDLDKLNFIEKIYLWQTAFEQTQ